MSTKLDSAYYPYDPDAYDSTTWNFEVVHDMNTYIDAAFRSYETNQAYLFIQDDCVLLDYVEDKVVDGPFLICDSDRYKSLRYTGFQEYGIDAAFRSATNKEAFIFSGEDCAVINYADHSITKGPMEITEMFPFLQGTGFEPESIDAAFDSNKQEPEAYLFDGDRYALINYGPDGRLIRHGPITQGFPSLTGTIFESGIDAAFASHKDNEAYIFKREFYALIHFPTATTTTDHSTVDAIHVKEILPSWPSLNGILPRKNSRSHSAVYKDGSDKYISDASYVSDVDSASHSD